MPELGERAMVELDVRREPPRRAADYRKHERKPVACGAHDRLGAAADADPGAHRSRLGRRIGALAREGRPGAARPRYGLFFQQLGEKLELLFEQDVVVIEAISEQ